MGRPTFCETFRMTALKTLHYLIVARATIAKITLDQSLEIALQVVESAPIGRVIY